ncbi:hypothetical protein ACE6H2_001777 [Prunus campanulata]
MYSQSQELLRDYHENEEEEASNCLRQRAHRAIDALPPNQARRLHLLPSALPPFTCPTPSLSSLRPSPPLPPLSPRLPSSLPHLASRSCSLFLRRRPHRTTSRPSHFRSLRFSRCLALC